MATRPDSEGNCPSFLTMLLVLGTIMVVLSAGINAASPPEPPLLISTQ